MSVDLHALIPLIALTFLLAGFVKGVVGLGLPTVSVGLLGLAMPPMQAAALLIVPSMVTNLWQLACGPRFLGLMKRLAGLLLGVIVGTLLVGAWLGGDAPRQATGVLGLALAAYALLGLAAIPLHLPARHEPWAGPLVGLATGALTAVTGVFVIPAVPYLGALGLQRDELVQALGLSFSASTLALAVTLGVHGDLLEPQMLLLRRSPAARRRPRLARFPLTPGTHCAPARAGLRPSRDFRRTAQVAIIRRRATPTGRAAPGGTRPSGTERHLSQGAHDEDPSFPFRPGPRLRHPGRLPEPAPG